MTPEQKIKLAILLDADKGCDINLPENITAENVDALYDEANDIGALYDSIAEMREGVVETELPTERSRHYENKAVAAKMPDGSWVGWTYWYGGGKHGEPESIEWMNEAYDLTCVEEEKLVVVRTFAKVVK